jgi:hypothetical protein
MGINNVIYMELHLGPKMANGTCGKTIVAETIDRDSTVYIFQYTCDIIDMYIIVPEHLSIACRSGLPSA